MFPQVRTSEARRALARGGWIAAGMALAIASVPVLVLEGARPSNALSQSGGTERPLFGLSLRSASAVLKRCEDAIASADMRLRPTLEWRALLLSCQAQAGFATARWPTDARAWLLDANMSALLGEVPRFSMALERSQDLAPFVQWLASRRIALADSTGPQGGYSYLRDILALLESDIGSRVVADLWLKGDAARRERIEAAALESRADLQQRLLAKIRDLGPLASP